MLENELEYVTNFLIETNGNDSPRSAETFRKRSEHSKRVLRYALEIVDSLTEEERMQINEKAIYMACVFHDVGYGVESFHNSHPIEGSQIFLDYARKNNLDPSFSKEVAFLILNHSDKDQIKYTNSNNLRILMEADMLDEEGAMAICWDLITLGHKNPQSYEDALKKIEAYSLNITKKDPMYHPYAKKLWENKQKLVMTFYNKLKEELFLE